MTDERLGDGLWPAIERLPRGSGIVFRHYATPADERRRIFARVVRLARARGLVVVRAGAWCGPGADGVHNRRGRGWRTKSAHSRAEARAAGRRGVDAVFVSPVFATRSHPGAEALGPRRAERIARELPVAAIALGGMDAERFRGLRGFYGWAGIDAWLPGKRREVNPPFDCLPRQALGTG
ncbi:thiamine phosphate synthase [Sphingomonas sp.]|jgi:thiamine-phosphate pyrophosphorylase|uniref:thiamine phosphate synthase n=1 Tax=Sphingomonas sp. TaxID=28214 RepID=UPI002E32427B|nr:thiamine phosphate synthase [Sphingomonas sp.]HEX4695371.1 thiamine phosphate synthase [Sphingomonas sp.]